MKSSKETFMKKICKELWLLWKKSVNWDKHTLRQKMIAVWFALSFILVAVVAESQVLEVIAIANLAAAAYNTVKYVPIPEED